MSKPDILQLGTYAKRDEQALSERFTVHRFFEVDDQAAYLKDKGDKIRAIATRGDLQTPAELIEALPNLELISVFGVGYDGVDLDAARRCGVKVTNTPDVLTEDVADFAVAMLLAQSRQIPQGDHRVRSGAWAESGPMRLNQRVFGKTAAILGLGRIGLAIAQRLDAFNMNIRYSARSPKDCPEHWQFIADPIDLANGADFYFVALAASSETRHIVNKQVISALGEKGMVINISRAANIDEQALLSALESGELGAAALDVFEDEPNVDPRFLALDNVLLQPHQGSATVETRHAMGDLVVANLQAHFDGKALLTPVL